MNTRYRHYEEDYDGNYYLFTNDDVRYFSEAICPTIQRIIEKYQDKIEQDLFIKDNHFYFTYKGVKWEFRLSSSIQEWEYANDVLNELNCVKGVSYVMYYGGVLD